MDGELFCFICLINDEIRAVKHEECDLIPLCAQASSHQFEYQSSHSASRHKNAVFWL
jgi:hypothetical protein